MIKTRHALRYGIVFLFWITLIPADMLASMVRIGTRSIELGVDLASGKIVALVDVPSQRNFLNPTPEGGLWELEFAGTPALILSSTNAQTCEVTMLRGDEPGLRLVWSQFNQSNAPSLSVEATIRLDQKQALSHWQLAVNSAPPLPIQRLRFPRLLDLPQLDREHLAVPFWGGLLAANPRQDISTNATAGWRREYDYPGLCSMQCLSLYSDAGPGLYVACDDTAGYRKSFAAFSHGEPGTNGAEQATAFTNSTLGAGRLRDINLEIVHMPDRSASTPQRYNLPYSVVLGTFRGDWFDAATIYRAWATNQSWAIASRWKQGKAPSWIVDTGLWIWNRGRSMDVLDPAIDMRREAGLPISVFWHWWHGCAYDTGFPEYLPPREGDTSFSAALNRAHEHDVRSLVYMNQRLWGMTTTSWTNENAMAFAVRAMDGQVKPEIYNSFTKLPCATMCIATEFWRKKYSGLASEVYNRLGVDGIYMDQACSSLACFDSQHGHPPGGGAYWMNGFKTLAADIRERCATRGSVALAGEGCAENWLPYLDLMLALDVSRERYAAPDGWTPIPFFHAVYHGHGVFFGNYSSLTMPPYDDLWPAEFAPKEQLALLDRQFSMQFCLEQARSFLWGQQPTLANFRPAQLRERPDEIAYVIRLARLRKLALKYLQDGMMLHPPSIEAPTSEISMSRLSIYAGQQDALKQFSTKVPLALASAWRAMDGSIAIAIASIADQTLNPTITINAAKYGVPQRAPFLDISEPDAQSTGEFVGNNLVLRPNLGPRQARIFEWKSK